MLALEQLLFNCIHVGQGPAGLPSTAWISGSCSVGWFLGGFSRMLIGD